MPQPCKEETPESINTYTDGSIKNAKVNHWKIGGVGVWWPHVKGEIAGRHELNEDELYVMHVDESNKGMMLWNTAKQPEEAVLGPSCLD